ncbi:hypothetical protein N5B55_03095 [Ralstonia pickettii]|uniref:hypothetical protein n=1 Tax=Ralstonia pickettii TaxID=329 RepID=UPI002714606C|nr:hypothetical protein [Ralstonia pickettii]WKZ85959.1 hypothetical protein N5B55_03095 [Ralstonia pickettii]
MPTSITDPKLNALLNAISDPAGKTAITNALLASPPLLAMYTDMANGNHGDQVLTKIDYNPDIGDKTGWYSSGTMHIGLGWISVSGSINQEKLSYLMGHEGQHDVDAADVAAADSTFNQAVSNKASSGGSQPHDYTAILAADQQAHLNDEGKADIAGWNAAVSALGHPPTATDISTLTSLLGHSFYDGNGNLKPGFAPDPNNPGQILITDPQTVANAANQYGNYTPSTGNGVADTYRQFYDGPKIDAIAIAENGRAFQID